MGHKWKSSSANVCQQAKKRARKSRPIYFSEVRWATKGVDGWIRTTLSIPSRIAETLNTSSKRTDAKNGDTDLAPRVDARYRRKPTAKAGEARRADAASERSALRCLRQKPALWE